MLSVVFRVREGPPAEVARGPVAGVSIAAEAWGTDILRERSFLWLVGSRLAILMAGAMLTQLAMFYLSAVAGPGARPRRVSVSSAWSGWSPSGRVIAVVPAARISDRVGRKPVIWASCVLGAVGLAICRRGADRCRRAIVGRRACTASRPGIFLAVDWALMTDIIPKASSGRYMGLSNVATASAGVLAIAVGGTLMDVVGGGDRGRARRCGWPSA